MTPTMSTTPTRHQRRWRWIRLAWLATFGLIVLFTAAGIPAYYQRALVAPTAVYDNVPDPALLAILAAAGIPARAYALYLLGSGLLSNLALVLVALLIFWRRGRELDALAMSYLLLLAGGGGPVGSAATTQLGPAGIWLDRTFSLISANAVTLLFFLFPSGRFVPRWTKWVALAFLLVTLPNFLAPGSRLDFLSKPALPVLLIIFPLLGSFVIAQVYRYRRVSGPIERLQTRWAMIGLLSWPLAWGISGVLPLFVPALKQVTAESLPPLILIDLLVLWPLYLLFPVGLGIAILRFRLYDIDFIIRRTLQYTLVTAVLALIYLGSVVLLQTLFDRMIGRQSPLITVVSTLLIAALFSPLRRRVQTTIDRRFFRHRYNAQQVLTAFAVTARDETDLDALTAELARVVQETMQPVAKSVWLEPGNRR